MLIFFGLVFAGVIALWVLAVRRQPQVKSQREAQQLQNRWIIWGGLVLPIASISLVLAFGIPAGHRMLAIGDDNALTIEVTAHQWWWQVNYPDSGIELRNEIHVPAGRPLDLHLTSSDVIHSFWVPRLGGKLDMFPGRVNVLRLTANEPGRYRGQCAEFCGVAHAHMQFELIAHSETDFEQWRTELTNHD